MWVFPLLASGVAFVFAGRLFADYARRRQPYQLAWAIALAMYGVASFVVVLGGARRLERSRVRACIGPWVPC